MSCDPCDICDSFQKERQEGSTGIMFRYANNGWDHHRIFYTIVTETPKSVIFESKTFEHFIELPKFSIWKYVLSLFWNENMF